MMDPEVKAAWIEDLRSGKYKQTKYALQDSEGGYCCLGVLNSITLPRLGKKSCPVTESGYEFDEFVGEDVIENLLGFNAFARIQLADLNDKGKSFSEIAVWIEKNL